MEIPAMFCLLLVCLTILYAGMVITLSSPLFRPVPVRKDLHGELPFVSVIIPARNEAENMPACLESILHQEYPADRYEILVSDDHSEDRTVQIVHQFIQDNPGSRIRLITPIDSSATGKKAALERAVQASQGELILATDADTHRGTRWIMVMVSELVDRNCEMVLGPVELTGGSSWLEQIQSLEFLGIMGFTAGSAGLGRPVMCNGANLLYAKRGYQETGGISSHARFASGDDQFLMAAIRKTFGKNSVSFALHRDAVVSTSPQPSLQAFFRQRIRWVSKSRGYRDAAVVSTGIIVYLEHLAIAAGLVAGIFLEPILWYALSCWVVKMAADLLPVIRMAAFFRKKALLWLFLPGQVFQLLYVVLSGILGPFLPYRWKGRLIRA